MPDDVDNLCNDYDILTKKLAEKEKICKELQDSSEKLNNALLYQLLKTQDQNSKENRALIYSTIILAYTATIIALATLGNDIWKDSGLPLFILWILTLFFVISGNYWIYIKYKSPIKA